MVEVRNALQHVFGDDQLFGFRHATAQPTAALAMRGAGGGAAQTMLGTRQCRGTKRAGTMLGLGAGHGLPSASATGSPAKVQRRTGGSFHLLRSGSVDTCQQRVGTRMSRNRSSPPHNGPDAPARPSASPPQPIAKATPTGVSGTPGAGQSCGSLSHLASCGRLHVGSIAGIIPLHGQTSACALAVTTSGRWLELHRPAFSKPGTLMHREVAHVAFRFSCAVATEANVVCTLHDGVLMSWSVMGAGVASSTAIESHVTRVATHEKTLVKAGTSLRLRPACSDAELARELICIPGGMCYLAQHGCVVCCFQSGSIIVVRIKVGCAFCVCEPRSSPSHGFGLRRVPLWPSWCQ